MIGFVLGIIVGLVFGADAKVLSPLGAVMNMNGTAIYEAVAVVFTAQIFGIELSFTQQVMISIEF